MSEQKHSLAPWALESEARHPWIVTCAIEGFPGLAGKVCEVGYLPNARLIAAAPDLLEALKTMLGIVEDALQDDSLDASTDAGAILCGDVMQDALHSTQVAIAKAEGRS